MKHFQRYDWTQNAIACQEGYDAIGQMMNYPQGYEEKFSRINDGLTNPSTLCFVIVILQYRKFRRNDANTKTRKLHTPI